MSNLGNILNDKITVNLSVTSILQILRNKETVDVLFDIPRDKVTKEMINTAIATTEDPQYWSNSYFLDANDWIYIIKRNNKMIGMINNDTIINEIKKYFISDSNVMRHLDKKYIDKEFIIYAIEHNVLYNIIWLLPFSDYDKFSIEDRDEFISLIYKKISVYEEIDFTIPFYIFNKKIPAEFYYKKYTNDDRCIGNAIKLQMKNFDLEDVISTFSEMFDNLSERDRADIKAHIPDFIFNVCELSMID